MIQGDPGQPITLTVATRAARNRSTSTIVRAEIKVPSVLGDLRKADEPAQWDYLYDKANKIGYIRITNFGETTADETKAAVEELEKQGVRGLVIDLRNNPGGLLHSAVEICDLFLESGVIVSTKGRNHKDEMWEAKPEGTLLLPADKHPDRGAGQQVQRQRQRDRRPRLQDHKRAVIVGERSYGKGSVQNIILMEHDTSALKLTTASYWRPSGKNIHRFPTARSSRRPASTPTSGACGPTTAATLTAESIAALQTAGVPEHRAGQAQGVSRLPFSHGKRLYGRAGANRCSADELS